MAVDERGRVGVFNPAAGRVLGVPVEAVLGRDLETLHAPEPLAAMAHVLREARRTSSAASRREVAVATPQGERILGYTVSVLGDEGATAIFFTDLTEARAEERRAAEIQRFVEVGKIASSLAHELKTPLATVELYAGLLRRSLGGSPEAVEQLDVIRDEAASCLDRLRGIMRSVNPDVAHASGVRLTPLSSAAHHVVADQRRRFPDAELRLRGGSSDPRVALSEPDVRSLVSNLVVNALEATKCRGPVDVRVAADGETVILRVADRGPGLPDGDVFAPFYTTKATGTGVGLWLVRRLVEEAGGTIAARDRRGGGTVMQVELPLPRRERLQGAELLVVEDDEPLRTASACLLESCGARVTAVGAGEEVPFGGPAWGCAILDYSLPGMTGLELASSLPDSTPVLLVSGHPGAGAALNEVRDRRVWYLPKPFEVDDYVDLVSLLLRPS